VSIAGFVFAARIGVGRVIGAFVSIGLAGTAGVAGPDPIEGVAGVAGVTGLP
jgi:hypothetical protein